MKNDKACATHNVDRYTAWWYGEDKRACMYNGRQHIESCRYFQRVLLRSERVFSACQLVRV